MKTIEKEVTSKGQVISKLKCQQADTLDEAIKLAGGEKEVVALFNQQFLTNAMNKARKPVADPMVKMVTAALKDDKVDQKAKDKILEILKAAGLKLGA